MPMAAALPILSLSSTVRASSVDTGHRLPYNPHRTYPKKPEALTAASSTLTTILDKNAAKISISELLKRDISKTGREVLDGTYLGYETWLPTPPLAEKPRSVLSLASLAYIGNCIYELYARRHFLFPPLNIEEYNDRVMAVVRCEAQDAMLRKLMSDGFLSQEESAYQLPLSIVVVGGLLAKSAEHTQEYWEYIAGNLNSIVNLEADEHCLKVLRMSYNHLPVHLKPCFLYMGVFSEDEKIPVSKLIRLWVAEGFLKPSSDGKSLEETANEYLIELIHRSMVLVHQLGCTGNIKSVHIHDLLRDLCLIEAEKQRFINVIRPHGFNFPQDTRSNQRRFVIPKISYQENGVKALQSMSRARSLKFWDSRGVLKLHNFRLLRIMSFSSFRHPYYHVHMLSLVNSRNLVLNLHPNATFYSSICLLWNLHTIIIESANNVRAPVEIWNMPQLRHFVSKCGIYLSRPSGGNTSMRGDIVLANLEILGRVINFKCCDARGGKEDPECKEIENTFHCCSLQGDGYILRNHTFPHSLRRLTFSPGVACGARSEDVLAGNNNRCIATS